MKNQLLTIGLLFLCIDATLARVDAQQPRRRSSNRSGSNLPVGAVICPLCHGKGHFGQLTVYERTVTRPDGSQQIQRMFGYDPDIPSDAILTASGGVGRGFDPNHRSCNVVGWIPGASQAAGTSQNGWVGLPRAIGPDVRNTGRRFTIPPWVRTDVEPLGTRFGCHSCGQGIGFVNGWIPDHMPPVGLSVRNATDFDPNGPTIDYYYRPHNSVCANRQGGLVSGLSTVAGDPGTKTASWERKWRNRDPRYDTYTDRGYPNDNHSARFAYAERDFIAQGWTEVTFR